MIPLELPPQLEQQVIQIAKVQNMRIDDYILSVLQERLANESQNNIDDDELYRLTGIRPLPARPNAQPITNDYINELREQYGI